MIMPDVKMSPEVKAARGRQSVFLVEDDPMVAHLFANHITRSRRYHFAGLGPTLVSAMSAMEQSRPDLVLLDVNML